MLAPEKYGLSKRPTYEELADYITRDPDKIHTPDRTGFLLRDHHMLSWLHDIKDFENRQEFADEEKNREEQFRRLRTLGLRLPQGLRDLGPQVREAANHSDLARLHEVMAAMDEHPVEYLPGNSGPGPSSAHPAAAVHEAIGIATPPDLETPDFQDPIEPEREHHNQCDMPHCDNDSTTTMPCCGRRLCDEHVTGILQYGGGRCPFCRQQPYIPGSLGASGSGGPVDEPKKRARALSVSSEAEEDSIAWDLLRAGAFAGRMAGKAAYLGTKHIALPAARGAASLAWRAFQPADRDQSLARSPDGTPNETRALLPQPTPGSAAQNSGGFRPLAILNGETASGRSPESQQPISWPRVSEVYRSRIVGKSSPGSAGVATRERFIGPGDPGYETSLGMRGRSPPSAPASSPPSREPSAPPTRRRVTGKKPGGNGYPPPK